MKWRPRLLKALLTVGLLGYLFQKFDVNASVLLTGIRNWSFVVAVCVLPLTVMPLLSVNRWQLFLRAYGIEERLFALWRINWIALFQGLALPSSQGFDLLRVYHIERRHPDKRGLAGSTVVVERMLGVGLLCVLSLAALWFVADTDAFVPIAWTVVLINAAVFVGMVLVLSERLHALYAARRTGVAVVDRAFGYLVALHGAVLRFPFRGLLARSLALIACFQLCAVASVYLLFRAYGYDIPFLQHVALYPMIAILSMAPVTIGGFGVREGLFAYFYSRLGVPFDVAIGVSILNYANLILIPALLGGLLCMWDVLVRPSKKQT